MPRRHTYVCLDCIQTAKREMWKTPVLCPNCGKYMMHITDNIPRKNDKQAWKQLKEKYVKWGWWTDKGDLETLLKVAKDSM